MIQGTDYCPAKAFISFARDFFEALAAGHHSAALARLDMTERRWSTDEVRRHIDAATSGLELCSTENYSRSASPVFDEVVPRALYRLTHRLPVAQGWSEAVAVFVFRRGRGGRFHVVLEDIRLPETKHRSSGSVKSRVPNNRVQPPGPTRG